MRTPDVEQNIRFTIELCKEDRKRLNDLIAALDARGREKCTEDVSAEQDSGGEVLKPIHTDEQAKSDTAVNEPEKEIRVADIQSKVVDLTAIDKKAEAREIVFAYAERVSDIPEDKRAEVYQRLIALEG